MKLLFTVSPGRLYPIGIARGILDIVRAGVRPVVNEVRKHGSKCQIISRCSVCNNCREGDIDRSDRLYP